LRAEAALLPDDGERVLGSVSLRGKRVYAYEEPDHPVMWITDEPVREGAGELWLELSVLAPTTGLQPILIAEPFLFCEPCDLAELDAMTGEDFFRERWEEAGEPFPGLVPKPPDALTMPEITEAVAGLPPLWLGLASVGRPADFLAMAGWSVTDAWQTALPVSAVLRSWEERFGARLLQVGPSAKIRLLVVRPPLTMESARGVAEELCAFGEAVWGGYDAWTEFTELEEVAEDILGEPIWGFWWD
jgi:hypothetical protein